jgi:hypothetical protein
MATTPGSRPGRKPSLTADDRTLATIEGAAKLQCTQGEAAAVLGCSRDPSHEFLKCPSRGACPLGQRA